MVVRLLEAVICVARLFRAKSLEHLFDSAGCLSTDSSVRLFVLLDLSEFPLRLIRSGASVKTLWATSVVKRRSAQNERVDLFGKLFTYNSVKTL